MNTQTIHIVKGAFKGDKVICILLKSEDIIPFPTDVTSSTTRTIHRKHEEKS